MIVCFVAWKKEKIAVEQIGESLPLVDKPIRSAPCHKTASLLNTRLRTQYEP